MKNVIVLFLALFVTINISAQKFKYTKVYSYLLDEKGNVDTSNIGFSYEKGKVSVKKDRIVFIKKDTKEKFEYIIDTNSYNHDNIIIYDCYMVTKNPTFKPKVRIVFDKLNRNILLGENYNTIMDVYQNAYKFSNKTSK